MRRLFKGMLFISLLLAGGAAAAQTDIGSLEKNFRNIPDEQQLAVYWYWMGGNMSKEGVVKDLQAMKKVGINRVQIGMIGNDQGAPQGPVKMFTDQWWDILHTMFKTAGELNIQVGLFNCPGWSQSGGPWVKPSQSMRYLASVKDTVSGPLKFNQKLPEVGKDAQDVKVLAFPFIASKVSFTPLEDVTKVTTINLSSPVAGKVRSLVLYPVQQTCSGSAELFVKDGDNYRSVDKFQIDRSNSAINVGFDPFAPIVISIPETEGKQFRLVVSTAGIIQKIRLSDVPVVERYPEKTFAKMWQTPHPMWDAYMWREQPQYTNSETVATDKVMDITSKMKADGTLTWNVPKGKWVIMRTAMLPTGSMDGPAPPEGRGLETDKMSKEHIRAHFDNYIGMILKKIPAEDRKTFKIVVEDSYETGGQNWTDKMIEDFKKAYGYDPVPYIPVYSGVVVGSEEMSDRFLWDVRRLIADEVSYNYVGGLRQVSNEHGLTTWLENYGHWGYPGEFLQYGSQSDEIAGEFWSFGDLGDIENRSASSCGHVYGKKKVWAESFTCGGPDFTQYPGQMKQRGDRFFTEGINSTLLHLYIQQPDDRVPGINAWFGNEFNRNNTWFSQMDIFAKYLKRCNYMLQQGRYVADVAYFLGEDAPKMTGIRNPEIPKGYSYDYVNGEVLMSASVKDGKLLLKSGMEYRVLVLPKINTMRPELLSKLKELVAAGLILQGPAPTKSPSLQNYPQADAQVKAMSDEMWQTKDQPFATSIVYGKGRIYPDASLEQIFGDLGVVADFSADDPALPLLFIHRTQADGDYYFVSNQSDQTISFNGAYRIQGKVPELWNPLTTEIRLLPNYRTLTKTTEIPMTLQPYESAFVVFRTPTDQKTGMGENYPQKTIVSKIEKQWTVAFQSGRGGPEKPVTFNTLSDWSKNSDPKIRFFSGTATYTNTFKVSKLPQGQVYLDLGKVMVLAKVKVNGVYVGGVWTAPYRLNITSALKKGNNTLEVEVVNCWRNRLIGEKSLPENERFTFQTATYLNKDSELQSSGLIGPVEIQSYNYQMLENK
ncbi:MAG: glycosyl hydrolase [Bacteroidaceae bacterium]